MSKSVLNPCMNDYISREAAIKAIMEHTGMTPIAKLVAETTICRVPAADVRPVVYCKDCKWYRESKVFAPNRFCYRLEDANGNNIGYNFAPNDFCSYGERRDGGDT